MENRIQSDSTNPCQIFLFFNLIVYIVYIWVHWAAAAYLSRMMREQGPQDRRGLQVTCENVSSKKTANCRSVW